MLEQAWRQYRGWAARARQLQAKTELLNRISLGLVVLTALLGTLSTQLPDHPRWPAICAMLAAVGAAVSAWLGREAFAMESESKWAKARSLAEAIKSECFRFAGRVAPYDGQDETARNEGLAKKLKDLRDAAGANEINPAEPDNKASPPADMTADWYREHRVEEQAGYYERARDENIRHLRRLQALSLAAIVLAAACGALAALTDYPRAAAWTGVITTIAASVSAWGMADRARVLAAEATRMINHLADLGTSTAKPLADYVTETEDLLRGEHARWLDTVSRTRAAAAAVAAEGKKPKDKTGA